MANGVRRAKVVGVGQKSAPNSPVRGRRGIALASAGAFVAAVAGTSAARAETCNFSSSGVADRVAGLPSFMSSASNTIVSAITTTNSVFLTQSTALVGTPPNAQPNQTGGGVWARAVGGEVNLTTAPKLSVSTFGSQVGLVSTLSGPVNCNSQVHASYGGVQVGADIGKLNINGWNIHVGVTAGSLSSHNNVVGGVVGGVPGGGAFNSWIQVPFAGLYATITGEYGIYADFLFRNDFYQANLNSPVLALFSQNLNARGVSFSGSTGFKYTIPNTEWFLEPSIGFIWARTAVDPLNSAGPFTRVGNVPGTLVINDIENAIGRLGLRGGTSLSIERLLLQPFAAVSVWHDFIATNSAHYDSCIGCAFLSGGGLALQPALAAIDFVGQNMGTYGQYSAGISGALADTGWLGFARFDYRKGNRLEGWNLTGGLRYQFSPQPVVMARSISKDPVGPVPVAEVPINWAGVYLGAYGAAAFGQGHFDFGVNGLRSSPRLGGFLGGGQIGYNYQIDNWVIGLEGEGGGLDAKGGKACSSQLNGGRPILNGQAVGAPLFNMTCNAQIDWTATLTARGGYAWDRTLVYVKGGAAWANENLFATCDLPAFSIPSLAFRSFAGCSTVAGLPTSGGFGISGVRTGWTVGAGVEFAITQQLSAKAEYAYLDFGKERRALPDGTSVGAGTNVSMVKIGVNYHLTPDLLGF